MTFFFLELIPCMAPDLELNVACIMPVRGREKAATSKYEETVREKIRHTKAIFFLYCLSIDHKSQK